MLLSLTLFAAGAVMGLRCGAVHLLLGAALIAAGSGIHLLQDLRIDLLDVLVFLALQTSFQAGFLFGAYLGTAAPRGRQRAAGVQ